MDSFAKLSPEERMLFFEQTAAHMGISPQIVEKDFWVCWTLKQLLQLPEIGQNLIFKGGTSLSKVFNLIERFSEDIDISIERSFLGFGGINEPEAGSSTNEKQRRIEALKETCGRKVKDELLPKLNALIHSKVRSDEKWSLYLDKTDPDGQTLLFEYPATLLPSTNVYIQRAVKIELGARADHWPFETKSIMPYVGELFSAAFAEVNCNVKVLAAERTFWEKATILHAEYHRPSEKSAPQRLSRHYGDFCNFIQKGVSDKAVGQLDLLERVALHKNLFFRSGWAKYSEAKKGSLRIVPPEHRVKVLREDYEKMRDMFFGEPTSFDVIMAVLKQWELEFNRG